MEIYILIIIIGVPLLLFLSRENGQQDSSLSITTTPSYTKKYSVMNKSEAAFFLELQKQLPIEYYIFPKMRIADVLDIPNGHEYYKMRNKALPKHIDFLICDRYFRPLIAVELNGGYHNNLIQKDKDRIKNDMFVNSGLVLKTVDVGSDFTKSIFDIKTSINSASE